MQIEKYMLQLIIKETVNKYENEMERYTDAT